MTRKQTSKSTNVKRKNNRETIAAIATPSGRGGVGIVRVSGPDVRDIAQRIIPTQLPPRKAVYTKFTMMNGEIIDEGIAILFVSPDSFTGEDVLELQGHGGPVVMDRLLQCVLAQGARLARPGEFSERAFLNDKIDLVQAEAIADLIDASSTQAAQSALRSLQGEFSRKINQLLSQLIELRMWVESAIDFPDEDIDFMAEEELPKKLNGLITQIDFVKNATKQGVVLREGIRVVIVGEPNAGKSSLLNCLSGEDSAIVTDIPGTTRDTLREMINIDGMPIHIIDTAGLRETTETVEQEGIRRAWTAIESADLVLLVSDATKTFDMNLLTKISDTLPILIIRNKIDLIGEKPTTTKMDKHTCIHVSAKHADGIDLLKKQLKQFAGYNDHGEGSFVARRRHLSAIDKTLQHLNHGLTQLTQHRAGELLAEDLRHAQNALGEITGQFSADDLLGKIFSSFCIGK